MFKKFKSFNIFFPLQLLFMLVVVFGSCSPLQTANRTAQKNQKVDLFPESKFNLDMAKSQLEKGKSTIQGILYVKTNKLSVVGGKTFGVLKKVDLFPVTPYLMEWYNLREKEEDKKTSVYMSEEAYSMRLEAQTDGYGRFTFSEMKPGRYFLQALMSTSQAHSRDVVVGTNSYGTQFYQKENYNTVKYHRVEKFVEIKKDGEVVEVMLKR